MIDLAIGALDTLVWELTHLAVEGHRANAAGVAMFGGLSPCDHVS